jgi:hypothetical protein
VASGDNENIPRRPAPVLVLLSIGIKTMDYQPRGEDRGGMGAMKLPKSQRAKEKAQNQARIEESERWWKSMTTEQQDEEILNERVKAKWKALDIELASHDKQPIDTVVTEMFTSSELALLPETLFPFVVIQYRGKTFLTCIANYRICEEGLACGLAVQNPDGLFLAAYDLNGKPWPCEDDQAVWNKPGIFFDQIMKPGVAPMLAVQLGQRIGELCL